MSGSFLEMGGVNDCDSFGRIYFETTKIGLFLPELLLNISIFPSNLDKNSLYAHNT